MKTKKRNQVIVVLIILLVTLAIAYAAFQDTLRISGMATGSGTLDLIFERGEIPVEYGTAVVSVDGKSLAVDIELGYPGDGVAVEAVILNQGTVPAKLTSFVLYEADEVTPYSNTDLIITFPNLDDDSVLPGENCDIVFTVKWDESYDEDELSAVSFVAKFEYTQDTDVIFDGSTSHGH